MITAVTPCGNMNKLKEEDYCSLLQQKTQFNCVDSISKDLINLIA